jgi:ABC-type Fe3+ transport system substrate-binding protein
MARCLRALSVASVVFAWTATDACSSYLTNPDYSLDADEQLYADLFKLPLPERRQKIVDGAKKEGGFELIYGFGGELGTNYFNLFKKIYPWVNAHGMFLSSTESNPRLIAEETTGKHITDVLSGTDIMDTNQGLDLGLFARYPTPKADKILQQYRYLEDPFHRWLLNTWEERGLSYNADAVKRLGAEPPATYFDLCKPEFEGQVSFDPPRDSFLAFFLKIFGKEKLVDWLKCMGKNRPIVTKGETLRLNLMMAGDHAIQGMNFFYAGMRLRDKLGADKVPFVPVYTAPIMANGEGCLINRNTPHPYTAALFCDWTLDDEPQAYIKSEYRGTVTLPHPFMPPDAPLVPILAEEPGAADELFQLWNQYIGSGRR